MTRIGSLCSGYRGLDMAIETVFGGTTAWVSDIDPGASRILTHHWPDVPNLGDLTTADWAAVEPVDIVCGGYPCQPFSLAGDLKGTDDERHLWPFIASALRVLRPRHAIFENVANHLRLGFDTVLCDLADLGFDVEWRVVRADHVGAPHQRRRLIILATASDAQGEGLPGPGLRGPAAERGAAAADAADLGHKRGGNARGRGAGPADGGLSAADSDGVGRRAGQQDVPAGQPDAAWCAPADTAGGGRADRPIGDHGLQFVSEPGAGGGDRERRDAEGVGEFDGRAPVVGWGQYASAVARWEAVLGRRAPWATDDQRRLSPAFVEWMMGLPAGHVTEVPELTRTQQLKALGNGVVPQQAEAALRLLADRAVLT